MQAYTETNSLLLKQTKIKAISYTTYIEKVAKLVAEGRSSGLLQTTERIGFTKLNAQRMRRLGKTIRLEAKILANLQTVLKPQTWLVLTESWCGDAAQALPVMHKIAEIQPKIQLQVLYRDEHPELMEAFLTNGAQSIPKLIAIDSNFEVLFTWGPRPKPATIMVEEYKKKHGGLSPELKEHLQLWYTKDMGRSIAAELSSLAGQ